MHSVDFASGFLRPEQLFALPPLCGKAPLMFEDACIRAASAFGQNQRWISNSFALLVDAGAFTRVSTDVRLIVAVDLPGWTNDFAKTRITEYLLTKGLLAEIAKAMYRTPTGARILDPLLLFPRLRGLVGLAVGIGILSLDAETGVIALTSSAVKHVRDSVCRQDYSRYERGLTPDGLSEIQGRQAIQGAEAEEFMLQREKCRLSNHPASHAIKRISLFNVSAGFDIQSFSDEDQVALNRFLEVKSYRKLSGFFWSTGEIRAAAELKEMYSLVLVDMARAADTNYVPAEIRNPYAVLDIERCIQSVSTSDRFTIIPTGFFIRFPSAVGTDERQITSEIGVDLDVEAHNIESS
jgi:hypothetical protein